MRGWLRNKLTLLNFFSFLALLSPIAAVCVFFAMMDNYISYATSTWALKILSITFTAGGLGIVFCSYRGAEQRTNKQRSR